jgi:hypothetical protein
MRLVATRKSFYRSDVVAVLEAERAPRLLGCRERVESLVHPVGEYRLEVAVITGVANCS